MTIADIVIRGDQERDFTGADIMNTRRALKNIFTPILARHKRAVEERRRQQVVGV